MHGTRNQRVVRVPATALVVAVLLVGACSKSETPGKAAAPPAPVVVESKPGEAILDPAADAALKERLARQEAASKMFERNVLQPAPPRSAEPKPAPEVPKVAEPPPAPPKPAPQEPPKPVVAAAPAEAPKAAPVAPAPAKTSPALQAPAKAAPRTDLAAAKPSTAPESTAPRLLSRVEPGFPAEAVRGGVDSGRVIARMTIDAAGRVTDVEILEAQPRRVFDRAVRVALSQWRFNDGAAGRTFESEIDFRR